MSVYDAISNKETELRLTVNSGEWLRIKSVRDDQVLLIVSDSNHVKNYLLNLNSLLLQEAADDFTILSTRAWNDEVVIVKYE